MRVSDPALAMFSVEELLDEVMSRRIVSCVMSVELDEATDETCPRKATNFVTHLLGDEDDLGVHEVQIRAEIVEYLGEQGD